MTLSTEFSVKENEEGAQEPFPGSWGMMAEATERDGRRAKR